MSLIYTFIQESLPKLLRLETLPKLLRFSFLLLEIQPDFNSSNTYGTMKMSSRQG